MKIKDWILKIGVFSIAIQFGCGENPRPVSIKKLVDPNPISYGFKLPVKELHDTIVKIFEFKNQMGNKILEDIFYYKNDGNYIQPVTFSTETADTAVFAENYFKKPNTKNDIFLNQYGDFWYSTMYFHDGKPFSYRTPYAIQLAGITKDSTLITIKALDPKIINGSRCCGMHLGNVSLEEPVKATTVEEYTLILYIAEKLGIKGMKPLHIPR
ncbi:MAG: hypothetical protein V4619_09910 [Bacteroidota bacterium]